MIPRCQDQGRSSLTQCVKKNSFQIHTVNGRTIKMQNFPATNGLVHTIDTFITSDSWTSCGDYIELASSLSTLETNMISVDLLDPLKGIYTVDDFCFEQFTLRMETTK